MSKLMPIETAPKDGTEIIGCRYDGHYKDYYIVRFVQMMGWKNPCWWNEDASEEVEGLTHWAPLPVLWGE